jgi:hypothetical protein
MPDLTSHKQAELPPSRAEKGKEIEHGSDASEHNDTITDISDDSTVEEPEADFVKPIHSTRGPRTFRQIGVGRIRLETLNLLSQYVKSGQYRARSPEDASSSSRSSELGDGDEDAEAPTDENSHVDAEGDAANQAAATSAGPTTARSAPPNKRGVPNNENENGDEDGNGPKRRSLNPKASNTPKSNLARFACPYQAYEPSRSCLRRTKRNPEGGCGGIIRLKYVLLPSLPANVILTSHFHPSRQHLARKHMASYRCPRCWISFDTRRKVTDHRDKGGCMEKRKPDDECFMDPLHEAQVEKAYSSISEEDTWWGLFRLLISTVQGLDEASLKAQYWPCESCPPHRLQITMRALTLHFSTTQTTFVSTCL